MERIVAQAARVMSRASSASGLLKRNMSTATGVSARMPPAMQAGCRAELALHGRVEDPDRRDAHEHLGQQDAERGQAEHPHRQRHDPQRGRRLVDGDRVGGVGAAEEERLPRVRPGLHRRGVEGVGPAVGGEVPQVERRRREQQPEQGGARPGGVGRRSSPEPTAEGPFTPGRGRGGARSIGSRVGRPPARCGEGSSRS